MLRISQLAVFLFGSFLALAGEEIDGTPKQGRDEANRMAVQPVGRAGGVVRDAQGNPLEGATVSFCELPGKKGARADLAVTKTDREGRWEIAVAPRAGFHLQLCIAHPRGRTFLVKLAEDNTPSPAAIFAQAAEVRLAPALVVTGTVAFGGQPVPQAAVYLRSWTSSELSQTVTDAAGHFEVSAGEEAPNTLVVVGKGFAPKYQAIETKVGMKPLSLELERGRRLTGKVVQEVAGKKRSVPNLPVFFEGEVNWPGPLPEKMLMGTTDATGHFTWENAPRMEVEYTVLQETGGQTSGAWDTTKDDELVIELDDDDDP